MAAKQPKTTGANLGPKWKATKATGQRHYVVTDGDSIFIAMSASKSLWLAQALNQHHAREGRDKAASIRTIARAMATLRSLDPDGPSVANPVPGMKNPPFWTLFRAPARRLYNTLFPAARATKK